MQSVCVRFTIQSATCSNKEKIAAVCTTQSRTPPLPFWPVVMLRHRYLLMPRSHSCVHYLRGVVIFMLSSSALSYIRITNVLCYPLQTDWGVLSQYGLFWTFHELFPLPMKCHEHCSVSAPSQSQHLHHLPLVQPELPWRVEASSTRSSNPVSRLSPEQFTCKICKGLQWVAAHCNCPCSGNWIQPLTLTYIWKQSSFLQFSSRIMAQLLWWFLWQWWPRFCQSNWEEASP